MLALRNNSPLPIHDVVIEVIFQNTNSHTIKKSIRVPAVISPSAEKILTTSFPYDPDLSILSTKITQLEIYHYEN
ncbi:MAG: hypothetical protein LVR00_01955 [Rhabdochlamydiaceae bacterium]